MYKQYTKSYIGWGVLLFFLAFVLMVFNVYLGSVVLIISIALFSHQKAILIDNQELQILSQFILLKLWKKFLLKELHIVKLESAATSGGSLASKSGNSWTKHTYCMSFYSDVYKDIPQFYFANYKGALKLLKQFTVYDNIQVINRVQEAQIKALKRRKNRQK